GARQRYLVPIPMGMLEMFPTYPMGRQTLAARHVGSRKLPTCSNIEGSQHEPETVSRKRRSRRSSFSPSGPNTARRRAETRWFDAPPTRSPANPLRRFKKRCAAKMLQNLGAAALVRAPGPIFSDRPPVSNSKDV